MKKNTNKTAAKTAQKNAQTAKGKPPRRVRLVLCGEFYDQIAKGEKTFELRDGTPRYDAMLLRNPPDEIEFSRGYTNDPKKLMAFKVKEIFRMSITVDEDTHTINYADMPLEQIDPKSVYAIKLGKRLY